MDDYTSTTLVCFILFCIFLIFGFSLCLYDMANSENISSTCKNNAISECDYYYCMVVHDINTDNNYLKYQMCINIKADSKNKTEAEKY